jgi:multidrug efflux system outer membrane protein
MKSLNKVFVLSLLMIALQACSVGPVYEKPLTAAPVAFKESSMDPLQAQKWKEAQPAEQLARGEWWAIFGDGVLNDLEVQARDANQNLKAAAARLKQARALQQNVRADLSPEVNAGLGPTRQRESPAAQGKDSGDSNSAKTLYRAQLDFSYEVDLFGRVSSAVESGDAQMQRSEALYRSVLLMLQADVAQAYFQLRQLDADVALYSSTVDLRERTLGIFQARFDAGDTEELDLSRAHSELSSAKADLLGFKRQRAVSEHALAILLGKNPSQFSFTPAPIQRVAIEIPAGLPSSLLERRPDIAAAERAMAASNADIGVAKAAFFPRLSLTGGLGFESDQLSNLGNWSSRTFLLGPLVGTMMSLPILDGGRRQANLDKERARYEEQVSNYRETVLNAFREVEDNLANLRLLADQTREQDDAVNAAAHAAQLALLRYSEGTSDQLQVIDADRSVLLQRRLSLQLDGDRAQHAVGLIRAIGGGWGV